MALVFMFHAKLTPLSLYRFSPQINLFNCFNPPPAPSAFICFGFVFCFFLAALPPPPLILCTKLLNNASFPLYLSLDGSYFWAFATRLVKEAQREDAGTQTKQYPSIVP